MEFLFLHTGVESWIKSQTYMDKKLDSFSWVHQSAEVKGDQPGQNLGEERQGERSVSLEDQPGTTKESPVRMTGKCLEQKKGLQLQAESCPLLDFFPRNPTEHLREDT